MKTMNRIFSGLLLATILLAGCKNTPIEFEDFTKQSVYFPLQTPIRTIVLGEDRIDNSIDLQKAFNIGVSIGGMYENKADRIVDFIIDPTIFPDVTAGKDTLYAKDMSNVNAKLFILPANYYTMVPDAKVTVPKGSFNGLIRINLTDDFFNDPDAYKLKYVLPLKITTPPAGFSMLSGTVSAPSIVAPRWYVLTDWLTGFTPRDYTLFAVKYINPWHGTFFHRGVQKKDAVVVKFHAVDISANQTAKIETVGMNKATYNRMGEKLTTATANYKTLLTFGDDVNGVGDITISQAPGTAYTISGSGKYYKSSTPFGKENGWTVDPLTDQIKGSLTLTLDFTVQGLAGATIHQFTDTLVFRSNDVKFEEFTIARPIK